MRFLAYGICALLTAACGDVLVEALQNAGAFGTTAIDANHQGVVPVLGIAALLLAVLGTAIARDRFVGSACGDQDWLAELARDVAGSTFRVHLATIVVSALALVLATEGYERNFGGALPFDIAHATIADALASLALYVLCATLVTFALSCLMRALASTCDALVRIVTFFATLFERNFGDASCPSVRSRDEFVRRPFFRLSGPFGDRAPPAAA